MKYSLPSIEKYSKKFNIDLVVINEKSFQGLGPDGNYNYNIFEKFQVYDLFEKYNRILRLDYDVIITEQCPNIFDVVPDNMIGAVYEDVGIKEQDRLREIENIQNAFGDINWKKKYFNSGVIIASREHRNIFNLNFSDIEIMRRSEGIRAKEQSLLNYYVQKQGVPVYELSHKYNYMKFFSEGLFRNRKRRKEGYIIHYAGPQGVKETDMKRDSKKLGMRN